MDVPEHEKEQLRKASKKLGIKPPRLPDIFKRNKAKGPNPLSCKKPSKDKKTPGRKKTKKDRIRAMAPEG